MLLLALPELDNAGAGQIGFKLCAARKRRAGHRTRVKLGIQMVNKALRNALPAEEASAPADVEELLSSVRDVTIEKARAFAV